MFPACLCRTERKLVVTVFRWTFTTVLNAEWDVQHRMWICTCISLYLFFYIHHNNEFRNKNKEVDTKSRYQAINQLKPPFYFVLSINVETYRASFMFGCERYWSLYQIWIKFSDLCVRYHKHYIHHLWWLISTQHE